MPIWEIFKRFLKNVLRINAKSSWGLLPIDATL
jgi:hypothetical protein